MGYTIVHITLFVVLFAADFLLVRFVVKNKTAKKIFFGCMLLVALALCTLPFENLFVKFDSPDDVFHYMKTGEIVAIDESGSSALIVYRVREGKYSMMCTKKKDSKYSICLPGYEKQIAQATDGKLVFSIYRVGGTDDYYLRVFGFSDEEIALSDNLETEFALSYEGSQETKSVIGIKNVAYTREYKLYLSGKEIMFK